jgi:methionyl aminopeptidase
MDDDTLNKYQEAGSILATSLSYGKDLIDVGASPLDIVDDVEAKIKEEGGEIAFPAQLSINDTAAHACPDNDDTSTLDEGDVVKLDIGVHVDGYIADSAVTVDLGDNAELVTAAEDALAAAIDLIRPGTRLSDIGKAIQDAIEAHGYSPVRNLSGHGLDRFIVHTGPNVPNHETGSDLILEEDMVIAIEPFATDGAGVIYESGNATVFKQEKRGNVRNRMARNVLKTIESYRGLPFTTRWLTREHSEGAVKVALRELLQRDIIKQYPPLVDKQHGLVAQAEHTVIVRDEPIITTERSED